MNDELRKNRPWPILVHSSRICLGREGGRKATKMVGAADFRNTTQKGEGKVVPVL
jgi:hypothetical protein